MPCVIHKGSQKTVRYRTPYKASCQCSLTPEQLRNSRRAAAAAIQQQQQRNATQTPHISLTGITIAARPNHEETATPSSRLQSTTSSPRPWLPQQREQRSASGPSSTPSAPSSTRNHATHSPSSAAHRHSSNAPSPKPPSPERHITKSSGARVKSSARANRAPRR
jgi:hypothetical protein